MEDKLIQVSDALMSIKRIEYLMEEMIFQQILTRSPKIDIPEANEKFKLALHNIDAQMKEYVDNLSPVTDKKKEKTGSIDV